MVNLDEQLNDSLQNLKGVGKKRAQAYSKLGLHTLFDLICHFPKDYDDCSKLFFVNEVKDEQKCCVKAKVVEKKIAFQSKRLNIFKVVAVDGKGSFLNINIFNNQFLFNRLQLSKAYVFWGKIEKKNAQITMVAPQTICESEMGFVAKYGLSAGLSSSVVSKNVRQIITQVQVSENLPKGLINKFGLVDRHTAFVDIHFPKNFNSLKEARRRLVFEELFFWQLSLKLLKSQQAVKTKCALLTTDLTDFLAVLPFELTSDQARVVEECVLNCRQGCVMNRLVQGDVGCGKTVVAQALCFLFVRSNFQVAVMAPTEILARQHFRNFSKVFSNFDVQISLLVGSLKKSERKNVLENLKAGKINIVIGTHSLFSDDVEFKNLGLVITDEQHRFGVLQRRKLVCKGNAPHVLVMSATPVPRTLALVIFADVDVSIIKKGPSYKAKIKTVHIPSAKRSRALSFIAAEVAKGHQAYIVCPLIEEGKKNAAAIVNYFEKLQQSAELKNVRLAMLHGRLAASQKDELMMQFIEKKVDVLVATSVVEVGIDNSSASVIMIENAELFGLASLHQLRGRVGRGSIDSFCVLISDSLSLNAKQRMEAMCLTSDGFKIAQFDLKLRGPGHFFGTLQHGLPNFKIANLIKNFDVVRLCSKLADNLLEIDFELKNHSGLLKAVKKFVESSSLII